jgi:hypothetical protein
MVLSPCRKAALAAFVTASLAATVAAAPFPMALMPGLPDAGDSPDLTATYCDLRATVNRKLKDDFSEDPALAALTATGMTMELWTSDLLGTWTVVHHGNDGISCIVTSGMDWANDGDPLALLEAVLEDQVYQS